MKPIRIAILTLVSALLLVSQSRRSYPPDRIWWGANQSGTLPATEDYDNADGMVGIINADGAVNPVGHAFFEALGTNGRACVTCHQPSNAMSVSVEAIQGRWRETGGTDPVFAAIDGSDCPSLPQDKASSHSLLLNRGLFRINAAWPPKGVAPDFQLEVVRDPTGCNLDPEYGLKGAAAMVSVFRRPRAAANLTHLTTGVDGEPSGILLMTDGREASLKTQALGAILGHEQADHQPTKQQLEQIVAFESRISASQSADIRGGMLTEPNAPPFLGPERIAGKIAPLPGWEQHVGPELAQLQKDFRASVARGSQVFFRGKNSCASCHNQAKGAVPMDIGTVNLPSPAADSPLPVFKASCKDGRAIYTQDPGRALVTGKCADIGAIVMQQLHGLASRAPYFSNGSAATLADVVDFYDMRYAAGYTEQEKRDLVNFLKVL